MKTNANNLLTNARVLNNFQEKKLAENLKKTCNKNPLKSKL